MGRYGLKLGLEKILYPNIPIFQHSIIPLPNYSTKSII